MNDDFDTLLASADPLPAERARSLTTLDVAYHELLDGTLATSAPRPRRSRRRTVLRFSVPVGAVCVALLAFVAFGSGGDDRSNTAWAAEQLRFADASPRVLLGADGWRVDYADESSAREGELTFRFGSAPPPELEGDGPFPADTNAAELNWRDGTLQEWRADRADGAAVTAEAPVLGTTAYVYQYTGGTPGHRDITALFEYDGRVLEFRAGATGIPAFERLLATLERVSADDWLAALPASAIPVADRPATVEAMLTGIPLPDGFDADQVDGDDLVNDRYQLGARVAGAVACRWFDQWFAAQQAQDTAAADDAYAALRTSRRWPIVVEMNKSGDYGRVLADMVRRMPSGDVGDVDEGLGCVDALR